MNTVGALGREVYEIQNPALGGVLLWRFATGYAQARSQPEATPLPALFVVLPLLFREESRALIAGTRLSSGLHAFLDKYRDSASPQNDLLLTLPHAVRLYQPLTWASFRVAVANRLLFLEPSTADVFVLSSTLPSGLPPRLSREWSVAERLGSWCGRLTLFELSTALRIPF